MSTIYGINANQLTIPTSPPQDPRINVAYAEITQLQRQVSNLELTKISHASQIQALQGQLLEEINQRRELQRLVEDLVKDLTAGVDTED